MKKELAVVLIAVDDFSNGRKAANSIKDSTFKNYNALHKAVCKFGTPLYPEKDIDLRVYRMNDFMEECNEQNIELEQFWVSYVYLTDKSFYTLSGNRSYSGNGFYYINQI